MRWPGGGVWGLGFGVDVGVLDKSWVDRWMIWRN